jgi:hypothetical protein
MPGGFCIAVRNQPPPVPGGAKWVADVALNRLNPYGDDIHIAASWGEQACASAEFAVHFICKKPEGWQQKEIGYGQQAGAEYSGHIPEYGSQR